MEETKIIKKNINVEVDDNTYYELRRNALDKKIDFHNYIRTVFQKEAGTNKKKR